MPIPWRPINAASDFFGIIISLIPILGMYRRWKDNRLYKHFAFTTICNALSLLCHGVMLLMDGTEGVGISIFTQTLCFIHHALSLCTLMALAVYVVIFLEERARALQWIRKSLLVFCVAAGIVLVVNLFSGVVYTFDGQNRFEAGQLACLYMVWPTAGLLLVASVAVRMRSCIGKGELAQLLLAVLIPVAAVVADLFNLPVSMVTIAPVLSLMIIYVSIQNEQLHRLGQRELDLSESSVALMLSQIQPHFMYNTLVAISQLCDISPVEASEMVGKFSQYLKVNVESLSQYAPVPFRDELDHVKIYLYIEQRRFEEKLNIEMDICAEDFSIPVLTLQPIVENAVRYGVTKREEGGTVRIATEDTGKSFRITVTDDGVGFDTSGHPPSDGRQHVGIQNVRSRLHSVSGGSLSISSTPGRGTVAVITLPKEGG